MVAPSANVTNPVGVEDGEPISLAILNFVLLRLSLAMADR